MEDALEKLKMLDYEKHFCQATCEAESACCTGPRDSGRC
eukprot:SAG31_NODE_9041_length_1344_cov_0.956627_1_plen_39_part_10